MDKPTVYDFGLKNCRSLKPVTGCSGSIVRFLSNVFVQMFVPRTYMRALLTFTFCANLFGNIKPRLRLRSRMKSPLYKYRVDTSLEDVPLPYTKRGTSVISPGLRQRCNSLRL